MFISKNQTNLIAKALRDYAALICNNPDRYDVQLCRSLDRALRSCPGISDVDVVWVRWEYLGEWRGWLTYNERVFIKDKYVYPNEETEEE